MASPGCEVVAPPSTTLGVVVVVVDALGAVVVEAVRVLAVGVIAVRTGGHQSGHCRRR